VIGSASDLYNVQRETKDIHDIPLVALAPKDEYASTETCSVYVHETAGMDGWKED
jgi:hypothetical protein